MNKDINDRLKLFTICGLLVVFSALIAGKVVDNKLVTLAAVGSRTDPIRPNTQLVTSDGQNTAMAGDDECLHNAGVNNHMHYLYCLYGFYQSTCGEHPSRECCRGVGREAFVRELGACILGYPGFPPTVPTTQPGTDN